MRTKLAALGNTVIPGSAASFGTNRSRVATIRRVRSASSGASRSRIVAADSVTALTL